MLTLQDAYEGYKRSREGELSPRSLVWVQQKVDVHLKDLLDKPMDQITPKVCRELHERLSRSSGTYSANGVARVLKAIWSDAARTEDLPPNPVVRGVRMNKEWPAELHIELEDLPQVWRDLDSIQDRVRRACWLTLLLTGLRSHDARSMAWANLDLDGMVLHVPSPKGGRDRAFDLPLCAYLVGELDALPRTSEWLFPKRKAYLTELRRTTEFNHNPHSFRRLYRTLAIEAQVDFVCCKLLMNHSLAGDVSMRYVSKRQVLGPMRAGAEKIASLILSHRGK